MQKAKLQRKEVLVRKAERIAKLQKKQRKRRRE
jgi:hypothetical protein